MSKVILIKSESDGPDKFVQVLKNSDFIVESIPSIDFQFKNLDKLSDKLRNHAVFDGIVFTSPRAVYGTQKALETYGDEMINDWISKEFNYTVGEGTAKLVQSLLNIPTKGSDAGNALNLSSIIADDYAKNFGAFRKLLFPCGNLRQNILETNLKQNSIGLDAVEVYETIQHPNLENSIKDLKNIDFLVFFSPSSVNYSYPFLQKYNLDMSKIKNIAIGPSTEKCLAKYDMKCDGACEKPIPESLLQILKNLQNQK